MKTVQEPEVEFAAAPLPPEKSALSDVEIKLKALAELQGYKALAERTADVFGDEITAARWLSEPSPDFAGRPPIQAAMEVDYDPERIAAIFEPVFTVIEHGIYT